MTYLIVTITFEFETKGYFISEDKGWEYETEEYEYDVEEEDIKEEIVSILMEEFKIPTELKEKVYKFCGDTDSWESLCEYLEDKGELIERLKERVYDKAYDEWEEIRE